MGLRVVSDPESVVGNMEIGVPGGMASTIGKIRVEWRNSMYNAYSKGDHVTHGAPHQHVDSLA